MAGARGITQLLKSLIGVVFHLVPVCNGMRTQSDGFCCGKVLRPKIYAKGPHTVKVINPATGKTKTLKGVKPAGGKVTVKF